MHPIPISNRVPRRPPRQCKSTGKVVRWVLSGIGIVIAAGAVADKMGLPALEAKAVEQIKNSLTQQVELNSLDVSEQPAQPAGSARSAAEYYSAGDFYYYRGERVPLHRSLIEYAVQFKAELTEEIKHTIVKSLSPLAEMTKPRQLKDQALVIVKLDKVKGPTEIEGILDTMQANRDVAFAAPVYIHPETHTKMLLTQRSWLN
jgi:hypothetical protein